MDAEAAARAWVDGWSWAWPNRDVEAVARLYTEDAVYLTHPFRAPHRGERGVREYVRSAFAEEEAIEFWFGDPVAAGKRAAIEYWAILGAEGGNEVTLAGTSVLRFASDGRCEEHRDYWSIEEGARRPPPGWGT